MKIFFSEEDKSNEANKIHLEDILFIGDYIEGENLTYKMVGKAIIDEETYNNFIVEFTLKEEPKNLSISNIMDVEWLYYNYIF